MLKQQLSNNIETNCKANKIGCKIEAILATVMMTMTIMLHDLHWKTGRRAARLVWHINYNKLKCFKGK